MDDPINTDPPVTAAVCYAGWPPLSSAYKATTGCYQSSASELGVAHRHWRRAKFFQQYRLFFRFHTRSRLIVMGWVNDTDTKRPYDSKTRPVGSGWIDRHGPDHGGSRVPSWRALDSWEAENALWELRRYLPPAAPQLQ